MHEGEQVSLKEFPGRVDVGGSRDGRPVQKFDGCLETLPVGLSDIRDSTALNSFSDNSQRDVHFDKHVVRRTYWSEEEQHMFSGKFVKIRSRRDGVPLDEIRVGKLTD